MTAHHLSTHLLFAHTFDAEGFRERMMWRLARIRHLERIEQGLRHTLEDFVEQRGTLEAVLADVAALERWAASLREQVEAVAEVRKSRVD